MKSETLLITRKQVASLLTIEECIAAVENAFNMRARGHAAAPAILGVPANEGGFHIKAGIMDLGTRYFVSKTNANFPGNPKRNGLPTIQGIIVVSNADDGRLLALIDSMEVTIIRTGAATAVAAKYLSRKNSRVVTICGCGNQGRISLHALLAVRKIEKAFAFDTDRDIMNNFILDMTKECDIPILPVHDLSEALRESDICITCTPSQSFFIREQYVRPGLFIAAVGADSEDKQEIDPALVAKSKVVCDSIDQCANIGELHHVIEKGLMSKASVYSELGEVIAGAKMGRENENEIIVFDSTGTALQDVVSAAIVYERALKESVGVKISFAE